MIVSVRLQLMSSFAVHFPRRAVSSCQWIRALVCSIVLGNRSNAVESSEQDVCSAAFTLEMEAFVPSFPAVDAESVMLIAVAVRTTAGYVVEGVMTNNSFCFM